MYFSIIDFQISTFCFNQQQQQQDFGSWQQPFGNQFVLSGFRGISSSSAPAE
jgi:hypothetical protein